MGRRPQERRRSPLTAEERILGAVLDVLAEHGVDRLSIRSVAQAAGISPAQVQYYYRTKRDLVRAGFEYSSGQFLAAVAAAEPATLRELTLQWLPLDEARERRARVWLAYTEMAARDEQLAAEAARTDEELRQWFTGAGVPGPQAAMLLAVIDGVTAQCLVLPLPRRRELAEKTLLAFLDDQNLNVKLDR